jgi:preprotein translocase subunit SecD
MKTGSRITSIKFTAQPKNDIQVVSNDNETKEYKAIQQKLISEMMALGIKTKSIDKWFNSYHIPIIKRNFDYTVKQYLSKKIKTITAYMNKALEYDFWQSAEMEKILSMRLKNLEQTEQQRLQFEHKELEQKKIEQKNKILEKFCSLDTKLQQEILDKICIEYPHIKDYFIRKGLGGSYAKDFIFAVMQKMKLDV